MIVEKLAPEMMAGFIADPRIQCCPPDPEEMWNRLASNGWAWAVRFDDGRLAGACGLYLYDAADLRRAEMWAVFAPNASPLMVGVTRRTQAVLEASRGQFDHIQAHVARSFPQGHKWVLLLGFEPTGESLEAAGALHDLYIWRG